MPLQTTHWPGAGLKPRISGKDSGAATALATVGTVLWCIQLIPQIIRNYVVKDTEGVPPAMMFLWAAAGVPFGIYFLVEESNIVLQIQPQLFTFFALVTFGQSLYYPPVNMNVRKVVAIVIFQAILSAGIELAAALPLRPVYRRGVHWPNLIFGIIAAILLIIGLVPPYFELWKRQGRVVGINFVFLTLDSLGAILSLCALAVVKDQQLDILGLVLYIIVFAMEFGIFASHAIWSIRVHYFNLVPEPLEEENTSEDVISENKLRP